MQTSRVWRVLLPVVLLAVGLLLATSAHLASDTDIRAERRTELVDLIRAEQQRVQDGTDRVISLQRQIDAASAEGGGVERDPSLEAPLAAVTGPGLTVELDDAPLPASGVPEGYLVEDFVVHEQDVQAVINALWAGGAEAVSVMDQRVIATTAVRCVGSTLLVHGQVYAPPYTVAAVGPVERMERALDASPRVSLFAQYAALLGLGYDVESGEVTVPAFEAPIAVDYARVAG